MGRLSRASPLSGLFLASPLAPTCEVSICPTYSPFLQIIYLRKKESTRTWVGRGTEEDHALDETKSQTFNWLSHPSARRYSPLFNVPTTVSALLAAEIDDGLIPNNGCENSNQNFCISYHESSSASIRFPFLFSPPVGMGEGGVQLICYKILLFDMKRIK